MFAFITQHSPPSKLQTALLVSSLQKPLPTNATLSQPGTKKENNVDNQCDSLKGFYSKVYTFDFSSFDTPLTTLLGLHQESSGLNETNTFCISHCEGVARLILTRALALTLFPPEKDTVYHSDSK